MILKWKKHLLTEMPVIFSKNYKKADKESEELTEELYKQIGQLKVESEIHRLIGSEVFLGLDRAFFLKKCPPRHKKSPLEVLYSQ